MTLYRPINQAELDLISQSKWKSFPPRFDHQPIFYPVLNEQYAQEITTQWNIPTYGKGYVVKFEVNDEFIKDYSVHKVGLDHHLEYWIPSEDLQSMNDNILGKIELIGEYTTND
jgi:hypothetical protein